MEYLILLDPDTITGKGYSLKTLPLIIVVGKDGTIAKKFVGHTHGKTTKEVQDLIDAAVAGKTEAPFLYSMIWNYCKGANCR